MDYKKIIHEVHEDFNFVSFVDNIMAERTFTERELKTYTGERGRPAYIAFEGVVYDVSDCPKWYTGLHEQRHFAGFDLTRSLRKAPHAAEVFTRPCVKRVGVLAGEG